MCERIVRFAIVTVFCIRCILVDPRGIRRDAGEDTRVHSMATSNTPAHKSNLDYSAFDLGHKGASRITLTRVNCSIASADVLRRNATGVQQAVTFLHTDFGYDHFKKSVTGDLAFTDPSPASHNEFREVLGRSSSPWQAYGMDDVCEVHPLTQFDQCYVVLLDRITVLVLGIGDKFLCMKYCRLSEFVHVMMAQYDADLHDSCLR